LTRARYRGSNCSDLLLGFLNSPVVHFYRNGVQPHAEHEGGRGRSHAESDPCPGGPESGQSERSGGHLPSPIGGPICPKWLFWVTLGYAGCRLARTENPRVGGSIPPPATTSDKYPTVFGCVSALSQVRSSLVDDLTNRGNHHFRLKVQNFAVAGTHHFVDAIC